MDLNEDLYGRRLGDDFVLGFSLTDPSTGAPISVAGWTGTLTIYDFSGVVKATASLVIGSADGGQFSYTVPAATTGAFPLEYMRYKAAYFNGLTETLVAGTIFWEPAIP